MNAREIDSRDTVFCSLIEDEMWAAERKYDGRRLMIVVDDAKVKFVGRNGQTASAKSALRKRFAYFESTFSQVGDGIFDGEMMSDGTFVLFDVPFLAGHVDSDAPWHRRRLVVETVASAVNHVQAAEVATTRTAKRELWKKVTENGFEGVVLKNKTSVYEWKRSYSWRKAKVTATADLIVLSRDETSCRLGGLRDGVITEFCGAGVKQALNNAIDLGVIVEVRYLYGDNHLVQPRIVRVRSDKTVDDVTCWEDVRLVRR
jgi:ATP-dependent DNA ligase